MPDMAAMMKSMMGGGGGDGPAGEMPDMDTMMKAMAAGKGMPPGVSKRALKKGGARRR